MTTPASFRFCQVSWGSRGTCTRTSALQACQFSDYTAAVQESCTHTLLMSGCSCCHLCGGPVFPQETVLLICIDLEGPNAFEGHLLIILLC